MAYNSNLFSAGAGTLHPPPAPLMGLGMMSTAQPPLPSYSNNQNQMMTSQEQQQQQVMQQQMQQMQQQYQQQMQQMQAQQINHLMHPAMNDQPLEFNNSKNKPSTPIVNEQSSNGSDRKSVDDDRRSDIRESRDNRRGGRDRDRRDRRDRDRDRDRNDRSDSDRKSKRESETEKEQPIMPPPSSTGPNTPLPPSISGMSMMGMGGMMGSMMGGMGGMMGPGMVPMMGGMDPMMAMGQYGMVQGMMPEGSMLPADSTMGPIIGTDGVFPTQRPVLEFKECSLVPPSPMAPTPLTRERPPGCRTVYVGGLPDNCTEDIIRDVFGRCGEMLTVRLSRKNFCHIRYAHEASVDAAMLYSGYRMRIGNNTDSANTGRLHVDYAQARVDQYEFECKQRALQREARHRERVERDRVRPASPPPIPHYTDHEAGTISENIKTDEGFVKSVQTVVAWLERGDLSKRNANTFYAMIQSTHSHVRRLLNEKMTYEEELQAAKDLHRTRVHNIVVQFGFIEKVFGCASHKKCWDHFTKAQRKNIETWKKQSSEIKQLQLVDGVTEEGDDEMDVSDTDDPDFGSVRKRPRLDSNAIKEENDSLRCQLEAYKNEVDLVKMDQKAELDAKDRQMKVLQQTIQSLRNELNINKTKLQVEEGIVKKLKAKEDEIEREEKESKEEAKVVIPSPPTLTSDKDARLIGLIATFLHVHPFGAGVDYVWSYLSKLDSTVRVNEVENLMSRFPGVFRQELSGIGATLERRWTFSGFEPPNF